jgi:ribonuclease HII
VGSDREGRRAVSVSPAALPTLRWEKRAWSDGHEIVAGVDEAGRGAWAGPLVAAAVVVPRDPRERARLTREINRANLIVNDSKRLSAAARQRVADVLGDLDIPCALCVVSVDELDAVGLGAANRLALCRAVDALSPSPKHVLVDAFRLDALKCGHDAIIHGDQRCQSIALASIVAKLRRDAIMQALGAEFPEYHFGVHKGYGTRLHREAIERHGITAQHRRSFAPIAAMNDGAAIGE